MELPISQLSPPPKKSRLFCEPDVLFMARLKQRMIADPTAPGVCPMAVLCKDKSSPSDLWRGTKMYINMRSWVVCTVYFAKSAYLGVSRQSIFQSSTCRCLYVLFLYMKLKDQK